MIKWQRLMKSETLGRAEVLDIQWRGADLLVFRTSEGDCHAITAYCPHMGNYIPNGLPPGQSLSALLEQDELRCPYHGWRFNGGGRCTSIPPGQAIPPAVRRGRPVARYWLIREKCGEIQIAEPEPGNEGANDASC